MYSEEIKRSRILQWALGALIFVYFIVFSDWIRMDVVTTTAYEALSYVCPPFFQSCDMFYVFQALPHGYSQTILYMAIFGILTWCVYLMSKKEWDTVQVLLMPIFVWHAAHPLLFSDYLAGNYEYYLIAFGLVLLFFPHKEFFLKLTLVMFYVLSTVSKIHPTWIEGGYFTALRTGLPLSPDWAIPLFSNLVILLEMIGAWFLMSSNRVVQRTVLSFFIIFHLYSGILVEYRYPATVLPFLLIVFGPWYRYTEVPLDKKSIAGWLFILLLILLQFSPKMIPGDEKMTAEANKYGLYMFEANHQCFSLAKVHYKDGTSRDINNRSILARNRCEPYHTWFRLNQVCLRDSEIDYIEWQFNHSINAGPFYKIVDVKNACNLSYKAFGRNHWILLPDEAETVGYPVKNYYH